MPIPQQVYQKNKRSPPKRRRRKQGLRLFVAYALQGIVILLCLLLIILLVCGCLYVREHLFQTLGDGQSSISYRFDDALSNSAKDSADGLYTGKPPPIEPTIPANSADDLPDSMVIVLDAGHGGIQAGCEFDGVLEKDITLAVTLLARDKLKDMGITVIMIREEDIDVSLDERCQIANDANADLFVSIHCNSYTEDTSINGFEGYYHDDAKGERLAQYIMDAASTLAIKTRHVRDENYKVLRDTAMPAALIEIGFLSNPSERKQLQTPEYQETIAQAIADGVLEMLKSQS